MRLTRMAGWMLAALMAAPMAWAAKPLTLMSYNVRNGRGLDEVTDAGRAAAVISRVAPDVVAIQEVDSATTRSEGRYVLADIAEDAGMHAWFAPAIDYRGGKYGIGLLTREQPLSISRMALPGREERRTMIVAEFPDYVMACSHLSLTPEDREASAAVMDSVARSYGGKPFFIAGDFNAEPDSPTMKTMDENFVAVSDVTTFTFPADKPDCTIDYIMLHKSTGDAVKVASARVLEEPVVSDHRPLVVKLTLDD